jgi:hypothetical protein
LHLHLHLPLPLHLHLHLHLHQHLHLPDSGPQYQRERSLGLPRVHLSQLPRVAA